MNRCNVSCKNKCVQVSSNGYISMGTRVSRTTPTIPGDSNIVSPYGADIDTSIAGTVRYTTGFSSSHPQMSSVSSFIQTRTRDYSFSGKRMMVVEWKNVAEYEGNSVSV